MHLPYTLSLKGTVRCERAGDDLLLMGLHTPPVRLASPPRTLLHLLDKLQAGGLTADALCQACADPGSSSDLARLYHQLGLLESRGLVCYTLPWAGAPWATLTPASAAFRLAPADPRRSYRVSRFACLHWAQGQAVLECPLGHARLVLHHPQVVALVARMAQPQTREALADALPGADTNCADALLALLASARVVFPCEPDGSIEEDHQAALRQWDFHDLLFHARSRAGRHDGAQGATYRFLGKVPPLPAGKPPMSPRRIALHRPDLQVLQASDPPFSQVSEARRSVRARGRQPLTATQLGEFLYRTARAQAVAPPAPESGAPYETVLRPCAGGGGVHEIELYLTVSRCDGLAAGLYHYDPVAHALEHLADPDARQHRMLADSRAAAGLTEAPDVLVTLAARFQRVAWKYESIAYAVILKNVGALYQQFYLAATAMDLAPCALGGGNSDLFAQASGLDYAAESSVGEFVLSSRERPVGPQQQGPHRQSAAAPGAP